MNQTPVDILQYLSREVEEHSDVLSLIQESVQDVFPRLVEGCLASIRQGHKLLFFGNGGSAADAQHLATELVVRYQKNRSAIRALALTTDTSALTAIGNDFGFDELFARQVEALCGPGDVAIGISTSGNSENVIRGLQMAKAKGALTAALTGGDGGRLRFHADHTLVVPSATTARIQEMHLLLGHALCGLLEARLGE